MKMSMLVVVLSASVLFGLAGLMGFRSGSWTSADDAWFDADAKVYQKFLAEPGKVRPSPLHPLIPFVWRPMGLGLTRVFRAVGVGDSPEMLAARVVVVGFASLALGAVWAVATALGVSLLSRSAVTVVGLLATSNLIACVPETYGISLGLLATSAAVVRSPMEARRKMATLAALSVLCAGSTITNGLYPGVALLGLVLRSDRLATFRSSWLTRKRGSQLAIAGILAGIAGAVVLWFVLPRLGQKFPNLRGHLLNWLHFRIYFEPARTLRDWGMGLIYPIVGPYPLILSGRVSYRSDLAHHGTWLHVMAGVTWFGLLVVGAWAGLGDRSTRSFTLGLLGWIGFNFGIHSVWGGPDNFLYSPHWSWALLLLAMMAASRLKPWIIVVACAAIVPAQVMTLQWLASAVANP